MFALTEIFNVGWAWIVLAVAVLLFSRRKRITCLIKDHDYHCPKKSYDGKLVCKRCNKKKRVNYD